MNNKIAWFFIIFVLLGSALGIAGFCVSVANADNQPGFYQIQGASDFDVIYDFRAGNTISLAIQTYKESGPYISTFVFSSSGNTVNVSTQRYNTVTSSAVAVYSYSFSVIPSDFLVFHFAWDPVPQNGWRLRVGVDSLVFNTSATSDDYAQYTLTTLNIGDVVGNPALNNRAQYLYLLPFSGSVTSVSPVVATTWDSVQLYPSGRYIVSEPTITNFFINYIVDNVDPKALDEFLQQELQNSYNNGYSAGQNAGYNTGYADGVNNAGEFTFMSLVDAIFFAPLKFLFNLLNFDLLGVNLLGLFTGLITVVVIITIVRIFI